MGVEGCQPNLLQSIINDRARLLRGEIVDIDNLDLEQTNVVRIFVSSTFSGNFIFLAKDNLFTFSSNVLESDLKNDHPLSRFYVMKENDKNQTI